VMRAGQSRPARALALSRLRRPDADNDPWQAFAKAGTDRRLSFEPVPAGLSFFLGHHFREAPGRIVLCSLAQLPLALDLR